jgi:hypothetical protein
MGRHILNELSMSGSGLWRAHLGPNYERTLRVLSTSGSWVYFRQIVKELLEFFQKMPCGYIGMLFYNELSTYSLSTLRTKW